uniref:Uncharacterized protein n=1 Tax=Alexandrium monilatum TaxID=311494 RepID=A0A7S4QCR8_9DINO
MTGISTLLKASCVLLTSLAHGLDDVVAAWQGNVFVGDVLQLLRHHPHVGDTWGPIVATDMSFVKAIDHALMSKYREPSGLRRQEAGMVRKKNKLSVRWNFLQTEFGTKQTAAFRHKCRTVAGGKQACDTDFDSANEASRVNIALAHGLTGLSTVTFAVQVRTGLLFQSTTIRCAVCGVPCKGSFMGREFSMQMPSCPIPDGTWVLTLPVPEVSQTAYVPNFEMQLRGTVVRETGGVVADFQVHVGTA